jgi:hypothetical protein
MLTADIRKNERQDEADEHGLPYGFVEDRGQPLDP